MKWTPTKLITLLCTPEMATTWKSERREHSHFHAGHVPPTLYDDSAEFAAALLDSGWREPEARGGEAQWPLTFVLVWADHDADPAFALAHHCEGDFAVEVFDDKNSLQAAFSDPPGRPSAGEATPTKPVTILELARHRLSAIGRTSGGEPARLTGVDFEAVELAILGGCELCGASIAAYNACPSRSGCWRCASGCIADEGYASVEEADRELFGATR